MGQVSILQDISFTLFSTQIAMHYEGISHLEQRYLK